MESAGQPLMSDGGSGGEKEGAEEGCQTQFETSLEPCCDEV